MITCPHCSLANPDGAQRCDCGFDFVSSRIKESYLSVGDKFIRPKTPKWVGFLPEIVALSVLMIVTLLQHPWWLMVAAGASIFALVLYIKR